MTSCQEVYDAFLSKVLDDEWADDEIPLSVKKLDWLQLLNAAIPYFRFPRVSLEHDKNNFESDLSNSEIQILASYMKCEWLNRNIMTWKHVKLMYDERDFSKANLIGRLEDALVYERKNAEHLQRSYYRSAADNQRLAGYHG